MKVQLRHHLLGPAIALSLVTIADAATPDSITVGGLPACSSDTEASATCHLPAPDDVRDWATSSPGVRVRQAGAHLDVAVRLAPQTSFVFGGGPFMCCDVQTYLAPVGDGLWAARLRVPGLDEAAFSVGVANVTTGAPSPVDFVGARASRLPVRAPAPGEQLAGVSHVAIESEVLGARRTLTVYRGAHCLTSMAGCRVYYLADGGRVATFVKNAPANSGRMLADLVLVGIDNAPDEDFGRKRSAELFKGFDDQAYRAFERYVVTEVIPRMEPASRVPRNRRFAVGASNGAVWALDMATAHPDLFGGAGVFSPGKDPGGDLSGAQVYVGSGALEDKFRAAARGIARRLERSHSLASEIYVVGGGHSDSTWNELFWRMVSQQRSVAHSQR